MALHNTTATDLNIPFCSPTDPIPAADYLLVAVNAFSVILNVLHIVVLSTMTSLKGTRYFHILLHISLSDIVFGFGLVVATTLNKPSYFSTVTFDMVALPWSFGTLTLWIRYWVMAVASFERYYALCRAESYMSAGVIKWLHIWLPLVWLVCYILAVIYMYGMGVEICFSKLIGPFFKRTPQLLAYYYTAQFAPSVVTAVLLVRILVELYRIRKKALTHNENLVKSATKCLIAIMALLYGGLLPPLITNVVLNVCKKCFSIIVIYYINNQLVLSLYGILNVLVYGFMTPAYRQQIRRLCCRHSCTAPA